MKRTAALLLTITASLFFLLLTLTACKVQEMGSKVAPSAPATQVDTTYTVTQGDDGIICMPYHTCYCDTTANCIADQPLLAPNEDLILAPTQEDDPHWDCSLMGNRSCTGSQGPILPKGCDIYNPTPATCGMATMRDH